MKKRESPDFRSPEVGISVVKPDWLIKPFPLRHAYYCINNYIAEMEVGCLEYPGASTIGSQALN